MSSARRQYGEGSISEYQTRAGPRYRAQWLEKTDPDDPASPTKLRSKAGFTTKKSAAAFLRDAVSTVERGGSTRPTGETLTLGAFMHEWLDGSRLEPTTIAGYRRILRLHIEPYLGTVPLARIRPQMLAAHYRQLERSGRQDPGHEGQPLGPNTVRKVHDLLSVALTAAQAAGHIESNPAKHPGAQPPTGAQVKSARRRMRVWTPQEAGRFLAWAEVVHADLCPAWVLAMRTGMRRSEILGLTWDRVDLRAGRAWVENAEVEVKERGRPEYRHTKLTKNRRMRTISIDQVVVSALRTHRSRMAEVHLAAVAGDAPVVALSDGRPCRPNHLTRRFANAVAQFNRDPETVDVPRIVLHELRHSHASHLLAAGVDPKVVQERLGHETITITMDTYTHVLPAHERDAMEKLATYLDV